MMKAVFLVAWVGFAGATQVSPVQKVIELIVDMQGKVKSDLAAEEAAMEEYLNFCDDETKAKSNAIETASRAIADLAAVVEDSKATISTNEDEVSTLGTTISAKEQELQETTAVRKAANGDFVAAEKELVKAVDECGRAAATLAKGLSFAQIKGGLRASKKIRKQLIAVQTALSAIVSAAWVDAGSARKLKSFLQQTEASTDDLSLHQPQAKVVAYESKSGAIVDAIKEMQAKAEGELSELRKKEMEDAHAFKMVEQTLSNEIKHSKEGLAAAASAKSGAEEAMAKAEGESSETSKTKAADEEYKETIKTECEVKATEWEARQKSGKEELGALDKAKEILSTGVKALMQVNSKHRVFEFGSDDMSDKRNQVAHQLQKLGRKFHSFALMSLASAASSDPFVKIRGLIEDMISKLVKAAEEEATQKAFCDEEMGKSSKSQEIKQGKLEKYQVRMDSATTSIAELEGAMKELEAEVAEIDKAQGEATAFRTKESSENRKAMKDWKDSADAVIAAIGVLKSFYEGGALLQTGSKTHTKQPSFGAAKTDAGSAIISVLEVAESDFTRLFAETESSENAAADAFAKLTTENKVSKATKQADVKAKTSEVKSLGVGLTQSTEDHKSTGQELDAVNDYIDKLKPQCESKAMSYEEKVARRNAEIDGLKEALNILSGDSLAMLQRH